MEPNSDLDRIESFIEISDTLGTAGQPFREEFTAIQKAGYRAVINLARPDSSHFLPDEDQVVSGLGMEYVPIPVVWEHPTRADLEQFFASMDRLQGQKVFVHCALNMRVSAFVFLYRVLRQEVPHAEARETMEMIWEPNEVWQRFIDESLSLPVFPVRGPDPE